MKTEHLQVVAFTVHRLEIKLNSTNQTEFSIIYNLLSNQTERNWFNCNNSKKNIISKVKILSYYLFIHNLSLNFQKIFNKTLKKTNKRSFLTAGIYFPPIRIYHTWGGKKIQLKNINMNFCGGIQLKATDV